LENDGKWNVLLLKSQKVVVFNKNFLFLTLLTSAPGTPLT